MSSAKSPSHSTHQGKRAALLGSQSGSPRLARHESLPDLALSLGNREPLWDVGFHLIPKLISNGLYNDLPAVVLSFVTPFTLVALPWFSPYPHEVPSHPIPTHWCTGKVRAARSLTRGV